MTSAWPWLGLALLGAYHGVNPAMGWLFAVALGLQERSRTALLQAVLFVALGHALSIGLFTAVLGGLQVVTSAPVLRLLGAAALIAFGLYKFLRPRSHPRWLGMRVSAWELALWSFLMSTAHGAGLMLFPLLMAAAPAHSHHAEHAGGASAPLARPDHWIPAAPAAVVVHTLAMLIVMTVVAVVVYEKVGLALLRRAWINFDLLWAITLVAAGVIALFT